MKIGQISDIHIGEDESLVQEIDVRKNFLDAINSESMKDLDLLVLSGDLANENAEPGAYKFIADQIKSVVGISAKVSLVAPKSVPRSEGKAKRVIDNRKL